jgi:hypothetical protein
VDANYRHSVGLRPAEFDSEAGGRLGGLRDKQVGISGEKALRVERLLGVLMRKNEVVFVGNVAAQKWPVEVGFEVYR